jgi:hypothetical protein
VDFSLEKYHTPHIYLIDVIFFSLNSHITPFFAQNSPNLLFVSISKGMHAMIKIDTTNCYGNIENLSASRIYHIPTTLLLLPKCMLASQNILTTPLLLP